MHGPAPLHSHEVEQVFFFRAPFDRRQVRDEGPCATAIYGLRGGFRAAGGLGRVPPCVGKELVQVGLWAISELSGGGELKERGREGALGCDSQEAGPARHPGGDGRRPQQARHGSGAMACKEAQELHGLAPKPAADLNPDDNQAAASGVAKFGVRLMPLAECRICQDVGARVCLTKTCEGGYNSGIDGELGSMPKREAVRDNLDAPLVGDGHVEVDVASNSRPLSLHVGGKEAAHHTADEAAEQAPAHADRSCPITAADMA